MSCAEEVELLAAAAEERPARAAAIRANEYFMLTIVATVEFLLEGMTETANTGSTGIYTLMVARKRKMGRLGY